MRGIVFILLSSFLGFSSFTQNNNLISTHPFFRDNLMFLYSNNSHAIPSMLPALESVYYSEHPYVEFVVIDSFIRKKPLFKRTFSKHLVDIKKDDYHLSISPVGELSIGNDVFDAGNQLLFQNTRGLYVEGDLFRNFSFSTSFYENQAVFSSYEKEFISTHGEFYTSNLGYTQQNGMVPGAARTKPFKANGFDYAFAIGNFVYRPTNNFSIIAGNNQQFIGNGYRSMLLSDNNYGTPYLRLDYNLNSKWSFNMIRSRNMNLIRKKAYTTVEAYYQPKGFSAHYISFKPNENMAFSFFEGSMWAMGDSLKTQAVNPSYFIPIPLMAALFNNGKTYSIFGLNANFNFFKKYLLYGQLVAGQLKNQFAVQVGARAYNFFGLTNIMLQLEWNKASKSMYIAENARLSYSNYNLPVAHISGTGFNEFLCRINWSFKKFYIDLRSNNFILSNYTKTSLLPVMNSALPQNGMVFNQNVEVGLKFNKKLNLSVFSSLLWRKEILENTNANLIFHFGMRTGLLSQPNDY